MEESSKMTSDEMYCLFVEEGIQVLNDSPFQLESLWFMLIFLVLTLPGE